MTSKVAHGTIAIAIAWLALGCSEASAPSPAPAPSAPTPAATPPPAPPPEPVDLAAEGRSAYLGNCIACHNPDPKLDGALGPAVWGAPRELLEARIMRAEYPPGYKPKRETASMIAMPFLEAKIPAIAAYLAGEGPG